MTSATSAHIAFVLPAGSVAKSLSTLGLASRAAATDASVARQKFNTHPCGMMESSPLQYEASARTYGPAACQRGVARRVLQG